MKFEGTRVWGFLNAAIGMRLPMSKDFANAVKNSDTYTSFESKRDLNEYAFTEVADNFIGEKDLALMQKLLKEDKLGGGQPNSKFMRMIHVQVAITAPLCWWKEFDTYKVGTTANSTSTMHKIQSYPIDASCFEKNPFTNDISKLVKPEAIEFFRDLYNSTEDAEAKKAIWYDIIYGLGDSWLQTRMIDLDYATIRNMVIWRKNHKQNCWSGLDNPTMDNFIKWVNTLPYAKELLLS